MKNEDDMHLHFCHTILARPLIDCASIIFGIIRHHENNFHLNFPKKSTASIICTFGWFAAQNCQFFFYGRDQCDRQI